MKDSRYDKNNPSVSVQVKSALAFALKSNEVLVIVRGSVFLMSEAREALGIDEPRDSKKILEVAGTSGLFKVKQKPSKT